jgi:anti-repressor protein
MDNKLQIFPYKGTDVRTFTKDGEPWFAGKDVCAVFGDKNHNRSLSRVSDEDKAAFTIDTSGGKQNITFVNETGLYDLLFSMQPQRAHHKGVRNEYPLKSRRELRN